VRPAYDDEPRVFASLRRSQCELLPQLRSIDGGDVRFTHAWGGPLGIARDWSASVGLDRRTGLGWAGGYVGDGVATSNLAGRTLADLVLDRDTDLVTLPWVHHHSRRWEPEPLRWLGVNAGLRAVRLADWEERRTHRPSVVARAMAPLIHGGRRAAQRPRLSSTVSTTESTTETRIITRQPLAPPTGRTRIGLTWCLSVGTVRPVTRIEVGHEEHRPRPRTTGPSRSPGRSLPTGSRGLRRSSAPPATLAGRCRRVSRR
jgi:hypothetical protein